MAGNFTVLAQSVAHINPVNSPFTVGRTGFEWLENQQSQIYDPPASFPGAFSGLIWSSSTDGVCAVILEVAQLSSQGLSVEIWSVNNRWLHEGGGIKPLSQFKHRCQIGLLFCLDLILWLKGQRESTPVRLKNQLYHCHLSKGIL